jgi:multidrug efflux pump subunit AcrB
LDLYARNIIKRKLETIKGVAKISIGGGRERISGSILILIV